MSVNLSIKNVPEDVAAKIRRQAERNHRSLQGELMAIVEAAARAETSEPSEGAPGHSGGSVESPSPLMPARQGWKSAAQLAAERRSAGRPRRPAIDNIPHAVDIVRADRDSR